MATLGDEGDFALEQEREVNSDELNRKSIRSFMG